MAFLLRSDNVLADERAFVTTPSKQQVLAISLRRLLPPIDVIDGKESQACLLLNDDIINCYTHFLSTIDPTTSVLTTWIAERLRRGEDFNAVCPYLRKVDWNNNLFFFPVHHPANVHWTLVTLEWIPGTPGFWQICHEDSIDDGQRGIWIVEKVQALVSHYLNVYYPKLSTITGAGARSEYVRITKKLDLSQKQSGEFRILPSTWTTQQTDTVNCGCFVLHRIESAIACLDHSIPTPSSSSYMQLYRNRVLLTLCDSRLKRQ